MMANDIEFLAESIRNLLDAELPGEFAHSKMIPQSRKLFPPFTPDKQAAVMVLLFPDEGCIKFSLIQRTRYNGAHSGQISFPGGMKEDADKNLQDTAIRETSEETGISPADIRIIGRLSPIQIPVSRFEVYPFVGYSTCRPKFKPDPVEVEFLINIPVLHFLEGKNRNIEKWNLQSADMDVPFFMYDTFKIWGATAMILSEFLDIIAMIEPDRWAAQYSDNDCSDT